MRKPRINPHQLVDRLEKKYQKKTRFQKYKSITNFIRQTILPERNVSMHRFKNNPTDIFDYEYIEP
jgi:hypothetical protein